MGAVLSGALITLLALTGTAAANPTPPFTQCPAVGFDTGCAILIVVNENGSLQSFNDPSQGPYDGVEDTLVGVQNNSARAVTSIPLTGTDIFGFDEDGLCSGVNSSGEPGFRPPPEGCPFGPTGYEGPNTSFTPINTNEGTVNFLNGEVAPGKSAYFSLEGRVEFNCEPQCHTVAPTTTTTTLSGGGQSGTSITVPTATAVSDTAALGGEHASEATGTVEYDVYSDNECKNLVASAGSVSVSGGVVPASSAETLSAGTYYWQAVYSGDVNNGGSRSACGSEVETVKGEECTTAKGVGHLGPRGQEGLNEDNSLSTSLHPHELEVSLGSHSGHIRLLSLTSARCVKSPGESEFSGTGAARFDGAGGYTLSFAIENAGGRVYLTLVVEKGGTVVYSLIHEELNKVSVEHIS